MSQIKSAHFFEVVAQEAIMGIMAFRLDTQECIFINNLAKEVLEYMPSGDSGMSMKIYLSDLYPKETRGKMRAFSEELVRYEGLLQEVMVSKINGQNFVANLGVKYLPGDDESQILMIMFQDITFQKKLQREISVKQDEIRNAYQELLEQNRQLKELDHAKDKFIALTTHELRTPLSAIVATAEAIVLKLYESEQQKDDFIKTIYEQGWALMDLVNDVLDFAKVQAGKMDYYIEQRSLNKLVARLTENVVHLCEQSKVTMSVNLPDEDVLCYFDEIRMSEVLNNVINNGIKYNREGGDLKIFLQTYGDFTRVVVKDSGIGIPEDKTSQVFNEFETLGNVSKHQKGTGLGMPISKRLMNGMGGELSLTSEVGVGTEFYIDIPNIKVLPEELYRSRPDKWGDLAA